MTTRSSKLIAAVIGTYAVAINTATAWLFWFDKQQAIKHQWRVRSMGKKNTIVSYRLFLIEMDQYPF